MKANELMIGDWVSYDGHNPDIPHGKVRVSCVARDIYELCVNDKKATYDYIHPIPLTAEILKANADGGSCSFDEFRSLYHFKTNGYHREISISFDKTWSVPFVEIIGMGQTTIKVNMQYVHELQRALRCCGQNDLADNFKIK